jgi:hypothetical protein
MHCIYKWMSEDSKFLYILNSLHKVLNDLYSALETFWGRFSAKSMQHSLFQKQLEFQLECASNIVFRWVRLHSWWNQREAGSSLYSCRQHSPFTWIIDGGTHCMPTWHIAALLSTASFCTYFQKLAQKLVTLGSSRKLQDVNQEKRDGLKCSTNGSNNKLTNSEQWNSGEHDHLYDLYERLMLTRVLERGA